jgi:peptidoglycan/LPS O-acetylase OafA/YrhL
LNISGRDSSGRLAVLDGFRAVAILAVLSFHYTVRWASPHDPASHLPNGGIFNGVLPLELGWLGVEFFFIISGFVILMTLDRCRNVLEFFLRRFARLWPAAIFAATMTSVLMCLIGPREWHVSFRDYLTSILLIDPHYMAALTHWRGLKWVDGAYWSLWVELKFYVLAAIVFQLARRKFILLWLFMQAAVFAYGAYTARDWHDLLFPAFLPYFTVGACLYEVWICRWQKVAVLGAIGAAAIALYDAGRGAGPFVGQDTVVSIIACTIVLVPVGLFASRSRLVRPFGWRPLAALGEASYSLYLIHQNVGVALIILLVRAGLPYLLVAPAVTAVMILSALLIFRFIEVPARQTLLKWFASAVGAFNKALPKLAYRIA